MRRRSAILILVAAIPLAAAFEPASRADAAHCAMTCHASAIGTGVTCCVSGREAGGPSVRFCGASREGVSPAPGCTLFAPDAIAELPRPFAVDSHSARSPEKPIARPLEPADPVPLRLS